MTPAPTFDVALALTAACAVLALVWRALTPGGAIAGYVVGACVSIGFGLPGLAVLGTFFVVGTLATRVGWKTKKARGTAEAGEGRRDAARVLGKGGIAAVFALLAAFDVPVVEFCFPGAVAAALADTLGTEIGTLFGGEPRALPSFRRVPVGTRGAVSLAGLVAAAVGGLAVGLVWARFHFAGKPAATVLLMASGVTVAGLLASLIESLVVGLGLCRSASGAERNVLTTLAGALLTLLGYVALLAVFADSWNGRGWQR